MNGLTIIIKTVGNDCNLQCAYCFYSQKHLKIDFIDFTLLEKIFSECVSHFSPPYRFIWHGGEPLLAGVQFFKRIIAKQNSIFGDKYIIKNHIQTNATLIDKNWVKFFKKYNFQIGVSIDGDMDCQDRFRKAIDGEGSFKNVMRGIRYLHENDIIPGIIQTLTRYNSSKVYENFVFFCDTLNLRKWAVNIYKDIGTSSHFTEEYCLSNQELYQFYKELIDIWLSRRDHTIHIREMDNLALGVLGKESKICMFNGTCAGNSICIDADGKVFPCSRFSMDSNFVIGDLNIHSLKDIFNSSKIRHFRRLITMYPDECKRCKWLKACNNGCPSMRNGLSGKYLYCEAIKAIFNYLAQYSEVLKEFNEKGNL